MTHDRSSARSNALRSTRVTWQASEKERWCSCVTRAIALTIFGGDVLGTGGVPRPLGVSGGTQLSGMTLEDWRNLKVSFCGSWMGPLSLLLHRPLAHWSVDLKSYLKVSFCP